MHAKPDLRVVLEWTIAGSGSVIADVIQTGLWQTPAIASVFTNWYLLENFFRDFGFRYAVKVQKNCLRRLVVASALLFSIASMGCATIANLNGSPTTLLQLPGLEEPQYFGGLKRYADGHFGIASIGDGGLFVMADTPLTLVGDVVTLPLVTRRN